MLLGITSAGVSALEYYAGIDVITTDSIGEQNAMYSTLILMSILGFSIAFFMIILMEERRGENLDRRNLSKPLDFDDRRSSVNRRDE